MSAMVEVSVAFAFLYAAGVASFGMLISFETLHPVRNNRSNAVMYIIITDFMVMYLSNMLLIDVCGLQYV